MIRMMTCMTTLKRPNVRRMSGKLTMRSIGRNIRLMSISTTPPRTNERHPPVTEKPLKNHARPYKAAPLRTLLPTIFNKNFTALTLAHCWTKVKSGFLRFFVKVVSFFTAVLILIPVFFSNVRVYIHLHKPQIILCFSLKQKRPYGRLHVLLLFAELQCVEPPIGF